MVVCEPGRTGSIPDPSELLLPAFTADTLKTNKEKVHVLRLYGGSEPI